jgi:hypothetical protein
VKHAIVAPMECAVEAARARHAGELSRLIVLDDLQQQLRTLLAAAPPQ